MNSGAGREYEWDEAKSRANVEERELPFSEIARFEWGTAVIRQSDRFGEERWLAISYIEDRLYAVVFTMREGRRRIISLRTASAKERRDYAEAETE